MASPDSQPTGVLLVQLGTPASTRVADVRSYLREFLSDPRVIDIPGPARWLLVNGIIAPFRAPKSAEAYRSIWTPEGSPLLVHSRAQAEALDRSLGAGFRVELAMRYGEPAIGAALDRLVAADVGRIVVQPLFPQYASSSSGSAAEAVMRAAAGRWNVPEITLLGDFHAEPGFIGAVAEAARPSLASLRPDHVLMSYHGLPERQVRKSDPGAAESGGSTPHCLVGEDCCASLGPHNRSCYRAQCFATSRALGQALGLSPEGFSTAFQSRLGRTPWISPYTDVVLPELAKAGVKRLAVMCPSFVADCLETVEEIGIRAREQWMELGGEAFEAVPCVNASPAFVEALAGRLRAAA